jgi:hypothetical protein
MTIDAPSTIAQLARYVARRTIRQLMQDDGFKPRDMTFAMLDNVARAWLANHPEAYAMAADYIERSPKLRAMAEREALQRERQRRTKCLTDAQRNKPCSDKTIPVQKSGAK